MTEQEFFATYYNQEGDYIGPKYSSYVSFDDNGDCWDNWYKRGDWEDIYHLPLGPLLPNGCMS